MTARPKLTKAQLSEIRRAVGRKGGLQRSAAKTEANRIKARLGGLARSEAKMEAAIENGRKGGRPPLPVAVKKAREQAKRDQKLPKFKPGFKDPLKRKASGKVKYHFYY